MYTIHYRIMIILYAGIICSYKKGVRTSMNYSRRVSKTCIFMFVSDMNFIKPMNSKNFSKNCSFL